MNLHVFSYSSDSDLSDFHMWSVRELCIWSWKGKRREKVKEMCIRPDAKFHVFPTKDVELLAARKECWERRQFLFVANTTWLLQGVLCTRFPPLCLLHPLEKVWGSFKQTRITWISQRQSSPALPSWSLREKPLQSREYTHLFFHWVPRHLILPRDLLNTTLNSQEGKSAKESECC